MGSDIKKDRNEKILESARPPQGGPAQLAEKKPPVRGLGGSGSGKCSAISRLSLSAAGIGVAYPCIDYVCLRLGIERLSTEQLEHSPRSWPVGTPASGLSLDSAAHVYHEALLAEIESGRHARLGDAVLTAQAAYADSGAFLELLAIYHLFGDPAMTLRP